MVQVGLKSTVSTREKACALKLTSEQGKNLLTVVVLLSCTLQVWLKVEHEEKE